MQVGAGAWVYLSQFAHTPTQATAACIFANLGVAVSDVVADSLVVEKVRASRLMPVLHGNSNIKRLLLMRSMQVQYAHWSAVTDHYLNMHGMALCTLLSMCNDRSQEVTSAIVPACVLCAQHLHLEIRLRSSAPYSSEQGCCRFDSFQYQVARTSVAGRNLCKSAIQSHTISAHLEGEHLSR